MTALSRRRPETRLVRGKSGPKQIQVERRTMPRVVAKAPEFVRAEPDKTGPIAVDCENRLRGRATFPVEFFAPEFGGN